MSDIVERMREWSECNVFPEQAQYVISEAVCEITRLRAEVEDLGNRLHHVHRLWANNEHALRAENEKLRVALEMFACDCVENDLCKFPHACRNYVARAALEEK